MKKQNHTEPEGNSGSIPRRLSGTSSGSFNLSEKIEEYGRRKNFIWVGDVKEAVKLLKEYKIGHNIVIPIVNFNKIFGEKLTK